MPQETASIEGWLAATLKADTALMALVTGIYANQAPQGAAYPFLLFSQQAGTDVNTLGARALVKAVYWIRVAMRGNSTEIATAAMDRVEALLQNVTGSRDGLTLTLYRLQPVTAPPENRGGIRYTQAGAFYRIVAS